MTGRADAARPAAVVVGGGLAGITTALRLAEAATGSPSPRGGRGSAAWPSRSSAVS